MNGFALVPALAEWLACPQLGVWAGFALIAGLIVCLVRFSSAPDVVMLGAAVLAALLGLMEPSAVFNGFADTSMLTVGAMYVVAAGVRETGALDRIGRWVMGPARTEAHAARRMMLLVTALSAFLNNTPIVAMFIPVVSGWCKSHRVAPSRLLMPLSQFTVLGGTCTLIGTSTNLVVQGMLKRSGHEPMAFFDLAWVGVPLAVLGGAYILVIGRRLLPERRDLIGEFGANRREYLVNLRVDAGCALAGKDVEAAGLRHLPGLFLAEIVRAGEIITPVRPDQRIETGDVLTFTGLVETIVDLERIPGLNPAETAEGFEEIERGLNEAVISPTSPLVGQSIRDADFRAAYNAAVLAVHRGGERLKGRIGDIVMRPGDTLLLQTGPHFGRAHRNNADFYLVSAIDDARPVRHRQASLSLALLAALVILLASEAMSTAMAAFLIAGLMVATRCIAPNVARQSLDLQTLITIAAAFGVSEALSQSGFVQAVADTGMRAGQAYGPHAVLAVVYLLTMVFTELLTNTATAALMFPFAIAIAETLGVDYKPFVMAVTYGASLSFMTPIGYQTNLMVYGPGGYRFGDFFKAGAPMSFMLLIAGVLLIPVFWPFHP